MVKLEGDVGLEEVAGLEGGVVGINVAAATVAKPIVNPTAIRIRNLPSSFMRAQCAGLHRCSH